MAEPVKLNSRREQLLYDYLSKEVFEVEGDRQELENKWKKHLIDFRAKVLGDGTAEVPFLGASDVPFPLTAMHFDPIYADLMQTLHVPSNFFSVTGLRADTIPQAKPLQEFLGIVERNFLKMRQVNKKAFIDLVVLGTCIYKDTIRHETKTIKKYDESGNETEEVMRIFDPQVLHIPIQDFFIPAYSSEIDPDEFGGAPWCGHRFDLTEGQLKIRSQGQDPWLPNYDKTNTKKVVDQIHDIQGEDTVEEVRRDQDEYRPFRDRKATLYEIWLRWDIDGDGIEEDLVVIWSQRARVALQITYNPFQHGKRPFDKAEYQPNKGFYGIGLAEQDEWAQLTMTRLLNTAVNNTLLANQRMFGVQPGTMWQPDEPIYGGKVIPLGVDGKIQEIRLGDVYSSMWNMLDRVLMYSDNTTGSTELKRGDISELPSRTPASTTQNMMRETNKRFDMVLANLRDSGLANIGQRTVQNIAQISQTDPQYIALAMEVLGPEDGQIVANILRQPVPIIADLFGVSVTATSSQVNKETDKQSMVSLGQLFAQFNPQQVQYAQALTQIMQQDPELQGILAQTLLAAYRGNNEMMTRMLESFDIQNPEQYLPPPEIANQIGQPAQQAAPPEFGELGGSRGAGPLAQAPEEILRTLGIG